MRLGRLIGIVALLALAGLAVWKFWPSATPGDDGSAGVSDAPAPAARPRILIPGAGPSRPSAEVVRSTPAGVLRYADRLNSAGETARDDVQLLVSLLQLYRNLSHRTNPVGNNAEITAFLTGRNPMGYAFIRPDCPAINYEGELCDRWGTPYYFHQISGTVMQVRSAGPDRQHWTADDIVGEP